jgi:hypothetical protein
MFLRDRCPLVAWRFMRCLALVILLLPACSSQTEPTTTTTTVIETTTTTVEETTTTTFPPECAPPPYRVDVLPAKVAGDAVDPDDIPRDDHLEVAGTSATIWLDDDGGLAVALIRGTLPLEQWPGVRYEAFIDGARAVAGPFEDGSWMVGWFEQPGDRCDLFTMIFYPPTDLDVVRATLASMDRTAG